MINLYVFGSIQLGDPKEKVWQKTSELGNEIIDKKLKMEVKKDVSSEQRL